MARCSTRAGRLIFALVALATSASALTLAQAATGSKPTASSPTELVVVKEHSTPKQYHRPGCSVVRDGKDVVAMTRSEAESRHYTAHRECDPAVGASANGPEDGRGTAPAPEPKVVIDAAGKYYHREHCPTIGASPQTVALKAVGKRWPCPSCRPPIRKPADAPLNPRWRG